MDLGMRPAGAFRMPPRIETVTMRDMSVVRRLVVRTRFVMPGGLLVVMRRLRVMLRSGGVMLYRLLGFGHRFPPRVSIMSFYDELTRVGCCSRVEAVVYEADEISCTKRRTSTAAALGRSNTRFSF